MADSKKILVTGGLGFIGSHTVVSLQDAGYEVLIIDDLSNTRIEMLDNIAKITHKKPNYFNIDLKNNGRFLNLTCDLLRI